MPAPAIAQCNPKPTSDPGFRSPARSSSRTLLNPQAQHEIPSVHRPTDSGNSGGEVWTGALALVRAQQKVPQELSPERELTRRAAHSTGDGQASAVRCAKSPIQGPYTQGRV